MWRWVLGLAAILGAVTGIFLGALNPDTVTLELGFIQWSASLGAIVVLSACVGLVLGFLFAGVLMLFRHRPRPTVPGIRQEAGKRLTDA